MAVTRLNVLLKPMNIGVRQRINLTLKSPPMLLTADAAYTLDHWNEKALPGFLTSTIDAVRSVQKLHQVVRQSGAQVVTGHDPEAWPTFKKAPDFYD